MSTTTVVVRDTIVTDPLTCPARHLAEAMAPWLPDSPAEVHDAIAAIHRAVCRGESTDGYTAFLGVEIDVHTDTISAPRRNACRPWHDPEHTPARTGSCKDRTGASNAGPGETTQTYASAVSNTTTARSNRGCLSIRQASSPSRKRAGWHAI